MTTRDIKRAGAAAHEHTRETGHSVTWTFGGTWFCEHCGARYEEDESH